MLRFQGNDNVDKNCERLQRKIDFTEKQTFEIVPLGQANGGSIILAVIVLAVFISFSGYLLIYNSQERGTAPDLYISQTALRELFPQYRVFRVAFDTDGQQDESILQELKLITASRSNIDVISRYERREEMRDYLITAKVLGTGLSVILLLVGVMNFVNTMVVNVNTRRYELAILESVGMTKRQIKRMLSMEGCYYWGVSIFLVATVGKLL